ncbi:SLAM family member 5-like [Pelobates cultripes]|uniref:SLAM family member 5-like n=1 Tax=Pelobates cultripes TaxID=61616 RepID=A0AAD1TGV0_PELCU|nr:SLAM family member 5-like [Pelobates cultripes]
MRNLKGRKVFPTYLIPQEHVKRIRFMGIELPPSNDVSRGFLCEESCGANKAVSGKVGKEVILAVNHSDIIDISWLIVKGNIHFATTKPNLSIDIRDKQYDGRLSALEYGSLKFSSLTKEDEGEYKADIRYAEEKHCGQRYVLQVSGNPSLSPVSCMVVVALAIISIFSE